MELKSPLNSTICGTLMECSTIWGGMFHDLGWNVPHSDRWNRGTTDCWNMVEYGGIPGCSRIPHNGVELVIVSRYHIRMYPNILIIMRYSKDCFSYIWSLKMCLFFVTDLINDILLEHNYTKQPIARSIAFVYFWNTVCWPYKIHYRLWWCNCSFNHASKYSNNYRMFKVLPQLHLVFQNVSCICTRFN